MRKFLPIILFLSMPLAAYAQYNENSEIYQNTLNNMQQQQQLQELQSQQQQMQQRQEQISIRQQQYQSEPLIQPMQNNQFHTVNPIDCCN